MAWDDEKRQKAVELYQAAEPTPENSTDILAEVAEQLGETPNGVRMILTRADAYVKKEPAAKSSSSSKSSGGGGTRVSKEEAHNRLEEAIKSVDQEPDSDIISKLTGKAAIYIAEVIEKSTS